VQTQKSSEHPLPSAGEISLLTILDSTCAFSSNFRKDSMSTTVSSINPLGRQTGINLVLCNNKFNVKVVSSKEDTSKGMMNKKFDKTFNGMLFLMEPGEHAFWMKNCKFPLDMIFIRDREIIYIEKDLILEGFF
jgi:hypothetical protein